GEYQAGAILLVAWANHILPRAESIAAEKWMPSQYVVAGDQHVGQTVAVEIDQPQVAVVEIHIRRPRPGRKRFPRGSVGGAAVVAERWVRKTDQRGAPLAERVDELSLAVEGR